VYRAAVDDGEASRACSDSASRLAGLMNGVASTMKGDAGTVAAAEASGNGAAVIVARFWWHQAYSRRAWGLDMQMQQRTRRICAHVEAAQNAVIE
jgi:hypothetical protein